MRAAHPAVQAEQRDPVGLTVQDPLAGVGQPERQPGEGAGVAQRRGRRERVAGLRLDQPVRAGTQAGERAEEPRVAEERRGFQVLFGQEGGGRRGRVVGDGLQGPPFGAGQAVTWGGQLLEQPEQCGPRNGSPGWSARAAAASADGSGWRRAAQAETAAASVSWLAGTRAGQSVSSSSAVSSPSPRKAGLPGNEPTTTSSGVWGGSRAASASASTS